MNDELDTFELKSRPKLSNRLVAIIVSITSAKLKGLIFKKHPQLATTIRQQLSTMPTMPLSTVSSSKLHCCLVVVILFILIFLALPLLFIFVANTNFESEISKPSNKVMNSGAINHANQLETHCVQRPQSSSTAATRPTFGLNDSLIINETLSSLDGNNAATTIDSSSSSSNNKLKINYCNETSSQTNQSPSNEYRKYLINFGLLQKSKPEPATTKASQSS